MAPPADTKHMPSFMASSLDLPGPYSLESVTRAALELRESLGRPASVAFAFATPDFIPHLEEFCETIRVDGHVTHVLGCTAGGRIHGANEIESGSGCSILALACDVGEPQALVSGSDFGHRKPSLSPNAWVLLANPYAFSSEDWLQDLNAKYPGVPCLGGLASGGEEQNVAVFLNGRAVDAVLLPVTGKTSIISVLSQGCRPIGEPLTVTRAEHNVIYALGGNPAYRALESAFDSLSDSEKSHARGNLFAGLAGTEYVDDFKSGDFLIRNIIGADPDTGAVVIGAIPRVGQTLQYQLRDCNVADADLDRALGEAPICGARPFAALLFSCLGRGSKFFGGPNHDAIRLSTAIGDKPSVGFFCNGEIAPVAGRNAVHGHTAAAAIWGEKREFE